ncbi:MAG: hypothetical protein BWY56_02172 [Acidobacteria bacterium ADurb.Bin340]|nr:MAG: hypothetical protein BWY56_02172 [Acidobacteria bacterium ADurb.Bin340]
MVRQAGIVHPGHLGLPEQPLGQGLGVVRGAAHAQVQGLEAPVQQPGGERIRGGARDLGNLPTADHGLLAPGDHPQHQVRMTAQVLGGAGHGQVAAQVAGAGEDGGGEGVVGHGQDAPVPGQPGHRRHIRDGQGGVAGAFHPHHRGAGREGCRPFVQVQRVLDPGDTQALGGFPALEELLRAQVEGRRDHHMVAGLQEGFEHSGKGAHAGAGEQGPVRPFQGRQHRFRFAEIGIAPAGVELGRLDGGRKLGAFGVLLQLEDGGLEDRGGDGAGAMA